MFWREVEFHVQEEWDYNLSLSPLQRGRDRRGKYTRRDAEPEASSECARGRANERDNRSERALPRIRVYTLGPTFRAYLSLIAANNNSSALTYDGPRGKRRRTGQRGTAAWRGKKFILNRSRFNVQIYLTVWSESFGRIMTLTFIVWRFENWANKKKKRKLRGSLKMNISEKKRMEVADIRRLDDTMRERRPGGRWITQSRGHRHRGFRRRERCPAATNRLLICTNDEKKKELREKKKTLHFERAR